MISFSDKTQSTASFEYVVPGKFLDTNSLIRSSLFLGVRMALKSKILRLYNFFLYRKKPYEIIQFTQCLEIRFLAAVCRLYI